MEDGRIKRELPVLLLWQILSRLPVRSLCRFRCVSKLWRSLISDPLFVEAHRARSEARPELLISSGWEPVFYPDGFVDPPIRWGEKRTRIQRQLYSAAYPLPGCSLKPACQGGGLIWVPGPMSHQVGGLYCLDSGTSVRLCNPATREFFDLETVFNPYLMKRTESNAAAVCITSHFGFDPVQRKHKVLTLWGAPYFDCYVFVLEDNYWTKILDKYPPEAVSVPGIHDVICLDGVIFSAPYSGDTSRGKQILVAFDVRTEAFRVVTHQLPECDRQRERQRKLMRKLIEFAGRAALVNLARLGSHGMWRLTLWLLEDLGQQVWSRKDCVIQQGVGGLSVRLKIQGGTPAGELILAPDSFPFFLIYNVEGNALRRFELRGLPREVSRDMFLRFHVESLFSPKAKQASSS